MAKTYRVEVEGGSGGSRRDAETYREITLDGADRRARGESLRIERGEEAGSASVRGAAGWQTPRRELPGW